ncbi:MAG: magnesium transporter [Chloroflexota bacterium]|nr:magnesium transporter [Chloroflexota bacterium]MDE2897238.1 magnesium transporter [Chloroflexota bacterium]
MNSGSDQVRADDALVHDITRLLASGDRAAAVRLLVADGDIDVSFLLAELSSEERQDLLASSPPAQSAALIERIEPEEAATALAGVELEVAADILGELTVDTAVEVLEGMDAGQAQELAQGMDEPGGVPAIFESYDEGTAGRLMTPNPFRLERRLTAGVALEAVRVAARATDAVTYLYVVDDSERLVGVVGLRALLAAEPEVPLHRLMTPDPVSVRTTTPGRECARLFRRHRYLGLPVTNEANVLLGLIRADRLVRLSDEESSEELLGIFGAGEFHAAESVFATARGRLPWLLINLATAFLAATVVAVFEDTIAAIVALAVFLPVIAGQAGNAGVQTVTVLIEMLATTEASSMVVRRALRRELKAALVHGAIIGLLVGLAAAVYARSALFGLVIALAMLIAMLVAGAAGALIPLILRRLGQNPALGSGVVVTTVTDVVGFLALLGLAAALLVSR